MNTQYILVILVVLCLTLYHFRTQPENITYETVETNNNNLIKNENKNNNSIEGFSVLKPFDIVKVILLYTKTCPHCIDFIPTWQKLKQLKKENVQFVEIESGEDIDDSFAKYNVKYVPTLIVHYDNKKDFHTYKGDRTLESVLEFLKLKGVHLDETLLEGFETGIGSYGSIGFDKDRNEYYIITPRLKLYINKNNNTIDPLFSILLTYIDQLKQNGITDKDRIIQELNKKEIKDIIKDHKIGICHRIKEIEDMYQNSPLNLQQLKNIENNVCKNIFTMENKNKT